MRLLYFARVREAIGRPDEEIELPAGVENVAGLLEWLRGRGPAYAAALASPATVRVALDRAHAGPEAPVRGVAEIALFPPMTGG